MPNGGIVNFDLNVFFNGFKTLSIIFQLLKGV